MWRWAARLAPFLSEAITTDEQREAFETIIRYLDGVTIAVPSDVQQYLDEIRENADAAVTQSASSALAAAMADPEKYIHDNKEMLEQYRAVAESESCKQKSIEKTKKVPQSLRDRKWA